MSRGRGAERGLALCEQVMWNAAVHAEFIHDHPDYGFETSGVRFNWR